MLILGIETSCDETGVAIYDSEKGLLGHKLYSQVKLHAEYGGVVPELASRDHINYIIPLIQDLLKDCKLDIQNIEAIAYTAGPGLSGALLVGSSVAESLACALGIKSIPIHHLEGHLLAPMLEKEKPEFPFIALLVSGGHSQLIHVKELGKYKIIGDTLDDAAGEAFDKCGKVIGLPYPAGPIVDQKAKDGDAKAFKFSKPRIKGLNYSFSGLKTSFLYKIRDELAENPDFIKDNLNNLCASLQNTIVDILLDKLRLASQQTGINQIGIAGGVSANSGLKHALEEEVVRSGWEIYIPKLAYTMDNAAMIGITGYYKYQKGLFSDQGIAPVARM